MADPTYEKKKIDADPIWELAFSMSEIQNDQAPIGWGDYIELARGILYTYTIKRKESKNG